MKIQEVTIEGYQSHTNSTFRLSPGLTVITGPSDAGKTAIIRALRWFAFNEPTGEAFLHTIRNPDGSVKEAVDQVKVSPNGIYGLNGDGWEWATGLRTNNGEIQILTGNNAAKNTADLTAGSAEWKAILPDGTLVAPGTAGTLKIDIVSGVPKISTTVKTTTSGDQWPSTSFKDLAVESGITIPDILKALAVFPSDNSDHGGDRFYARNDGEKCFFRGGRWSYTSYAGVFCLDGDDPRSSSYGTVGFRPAYILL